MNCKCSWVEAVLAIIIIIFAYMGSSSSQWVIIVAALLLLLHSFLCKKCRMCEEPVMPAKPFRSSSRSVRKRRR